MKLFIRFFFFKKVFCKIDKRMKKKKQEKEFMQKWEKKKKKGKREAVGVVVFSWNELEI